MAESRRRIEARTEARTRKSDDGSFLEAKMDMIQLLSARMIPPACACAIARLLTNTVILQAKTKGTHHVEADARRPMIR
jgi:hypothetical protein